MKEIVKKIEAIQRTLSGVSVSGPDNWNRLLGCMQALDEVREELTELETEEVEEDEDLCTGNERL